MLNRSPQAPNLPNRLQVTYTDDERRIVDTGLASHRHLIRSVEYWIDVGNAMNVLFDKAERLGRNAFVALQIQEGFVTRAGQPIDKGLISKARKMADKADAVLAWKQTLSPKQQDTWNNPNSVFAHCPLFPKTTNTTKGSGRTRKTPVTPKTEEELRAQASLRPSPEQISKVAAKQAAEAEAEAREFEAKGSSETTRQLEIEIEGLRSENAELKAQLETAKSGFNSLQAQFREMREIDVSRFGSDAEATITVLKSEIVGLKKRLKDGQKLHSHNTAPLTREEYGKIAKCLHTDRLKSIDANTLNEAMGILNKHRKKLVKEGGLSPANQISPDLREWDKQRATSEQKERAVKRAAKKAETKSQPSANGGLKWQQVIESFSEGHFTWEAAARVGKYQVTPISGFPSFEFDGYEVVHIENPDAPTTKQVRRLLSQRALKTATEAQAIAQADYDKRGAKTNQ